MQRKLVTVREITAINPILGADAIEVVTVDGWQVVSKKGEFQVGDLCVYFEIDSFLPESDPRYSFLMKSGVREFEGQRGHKLRTVKLRGQISQGLALPIKAFPEIENHVMNQAFDLVAHDQEGAVHDVDWFDQDFSELLGIKKYEAPIPAALAGQVKGGFPSFIQKTDQERCQNLIEEIFVLNIDSTFEVTTKLDGTSVTFYHNNDEVGVCSRNLELKISDENKDNSLVRMFIDSGLQLALPQLGNVAVQGELMGPGIQGNREGLKYQMYFIFDVQNIDEGRFLTPLERQTFMEQLINLGVNPARVTHVPIYAHDVTLQELGIMTLPDLLACAEGKSFINPVREGLVFKRTDGRFSFKSISNSFLAKEKD